jgi:hypothetical protein
VAGGVKQTNIIEIDVNANHCSENVRTEF